MENYPLVTVGIPNYNYARFIKEALDSAAAQTYPNIELILVDDCSTDNSVMVIENWIKNYEGSFKILFIQNPKNMGLSKSCNVILKNANGKYFQLLDSDDVIYPFKISKQVEILESSPNAALVYSNVSVVNEEGEITNPDYCDRIHYDKNNMPEGRVKDQLLEFNFITVHSALVHTARAKEVGGFDETLALQDYYMWLQLSEKYEIRFLNECTAFYRIHSSSMSNNVKTNPDSVNSSITLKYRYYKTSSPSIRKKIAKNIQFAAVYLYQHEHPASKKWLTIAFRLNPGIKTFLYSCSIRLNIPFSFFNKIKAISKR
ncbi:MAG: glycosyltransferase [Ginsengibacter sp.]